MQYHVTFLIGSEERTEQLDATDAASAVAQTQIEFGRGEEQFELISVQLDEPMPNDLEESED